MYLESNSMFIYLSKKYHQQTFTEKLIVASRLINFFRKAQDFQNNLLKRKLVFKKRKSTDKTLSEWVTL
jgi:hypothetical protein